MLFIVQVSYILLKEEMKHALHTDEKAVKVRRRKVIL